MAKGAAAALGGTPLLGTALAAGGGIAQGYFNRRGASEARRGIGQQIASIEAGKQAALPYLQPFFEVGQGALSPLSGLLTGRTFDPETGEFTQISPEERVALFQESPDFQFRLSEGQKALEASQAARGGLLSGRAIKESQALGQNLASAEYGSFLSRLRNLANLGQSSGASLANIVTGAAADVGRAQAESAGIRGDELINRGQLIAGTLRQGAQAFGAARRPPAIAPLPRGRA